MFLDVHTTPWTPSEALGSRPGSRLEHSAWGEGSWSCDLCSPVAGRGWSGEVREVRGVGLGEGCGGGMPSCTRVS